MKEEHPPTASHPCGSTRNENYISAVNSDKIGVSYAIFLNHAPNKPGKRFCKIMVEQNDSRYARAKRLCKSMGKMIHEEGFYYDQGPDVWYEIAN